MDAVVASLMQMLNTAKFLPTNEQATSAYNVPEGNDVVHAVVEYCAEVYHENRAAVVGMFDYCSKELFLGTNRAQDLPTSSAPCVLRKVWRIIVSSVRLNACEYGGQIHAAKALSPLATLGIGVATTGTR